MGFNKSSQAATRKIEIIGQKLVIGVVAQHWINLQSQIKQDGAVMHHHGAPAYPFAMILSPV